MPGSSHGSFAWMWMVEVTHDDNLPPCKTDFRANRNDEMFLVVQPAAPPYVADGMRPLFMRCFALFVNLSWRMRASLSNPNFKRFVWVPVCRRLLQPCPMPRSLTWVVAVSIYP